MRGWVGESASSNVSVADMMVAIAGGNGVRSRKAPLTVEMRMEPFKPPAVSQHPRIMTSNHLKKVSLYCM